MRELIDEDLGTTVPPASLDGLIDRVLADSQGWHSQEAAGEAACPSAAPSAGAGQSAFAGAGQSASATSSAGAGADSADAQNDCEEEDADAQNDCPEEDALDFLSQHSQGSDHSDATEYEEGVWAPPPSVRRLGEAFAEADMQN